MGLAVIRCARFRASFDQKREKRKMEEQCVVCGCSVELEDLNVCASTGDAFCDECSPVYLSSEIHREQRD